MTVMVTMMRMVVDNKYDYQNDVSDNDEDHKNSAVTGYDRMKILSDDCKTWLQNSLASYDPYVRVSASVFHRVNET